GALRGAPPRRVRSAPERLVPRVRDPDGREGARDRHPRGRGAGARRAVRREGNRRGTGDRGTRRHRERDRVGGRRPHARAPNDRTLAYAERSGGRLVPFVRLDLTERPLDEARRCLDLGARGIKLHPRAQAFALDDERLGPIFELAVARGVPILIHGGRGLPPIALNLASLVDRYQGVRLVVAHAGIADMADLTARLGGAPGVFFDTSVWSAVDLLDLFRQVAPEQIVYASDYPYGRQPNSLLLAIRTAHLAGFDDRQLRAMLGENA